MNPIKQKKIFLLIKNELVSKTLSAILAENSFIPTPFREEKALLKECLSNKPDIIIIFDYDEKLGNFYTGLRTTFTDVSIILLFSPGYINTFFEKEQPDAIIMKPFKIMELLDKLNKLLYSGDLETCPLPILLKNFYDERRTGVLHLTIEGVKYYVYFIEGDLVYAEYGIRKDTLGMLLLKENKITEEQYQNALNDASQNHARLGISLIKLGYLTPAELNEALKNQVYEKIVNCFEGKSGTFSFKFHGRFVDDIIIYKMNTQKVIFEGVKRHYDLKRLHLFYNDIKTKKFKIKNNQHNELDVFGFNTAELKIVSKLKSICYYDELGLKQDVDTLLLAQILFVLSVTGHLIIADKKEEIREDVIIPLKKAKIQEEPEESAIEEYVSKDELCETYLKIKTLNYYELLGVQRNAPPNDIKNAYMKLVKKFHPDRYAQQSDPDMAQKASEIFSKLSNAFKALTDETAKKEYDFTIDHKKEAELLSSANEIIQSEMEFLKGEKLLNQRDFAKAQDAFERALKLNPREPDYKCHFGWAYFLNQQNDKIKKIPFAKNVIEEALKAKPNMEKGYFFLGIIARFEGDINIAAKYFKKALIINPDNIEARRGLATLLTKAKK